MRAERNILLAGCLTAGAGALLLGFALDWDLLNYHLYNPHALLHGRHAVDLAPAQMQTFLNPAMHLPTYLLFQHGYSAAAVSLTGLIQGSQLLVVAALGPGGPVFLNQLGSSQGDTVLSLPFVSEEELQRLAGLRLCGLTAAP